MCGTFLREETRKARKNHRCEACHIPIPKGFRYVVTASVDDNGDSIASGKWHSECWEEFQRVLRENGDDCGHPDWTWENGMPPEVASKYFIGPLYPTEKQWELIEEASA